MLWFLLLAEFCVANINKIYYVALNGSDSNSGSITQPFATLNGARDAIRTLKQSNNGTLPSGDIIVYIREGQYINTNYNQYNNPLLSLSGRQDSGQSDARIIYSGYPNEKIELLGGYNIPSSYFKPAPNNQDLLVANLLDINNKLFSIIDYGKINGFGQLGECLNNRSELFVNGKRMILSRWPNVYINYTYNPNIKLFNWTNIDYVINNQTSFTYDDSIDEERIQMWLNELIQRNNTDNSIWLHGYWLYDWADSYVELINIDTNKKQIFTNPNTPPVYAYHSNARFMGLNILSELDTIDEYFFDTVKMDIYINKQKQNTLEDDVYTISVNPVIISLDGNNDGNNEHHDQYSIRNDKIYPQLNGNSSPQLQYISIENMSIAYATQSAIIATNVAHVNISIENIYAIGEHGVSILGYNNTIKNSYIAELGCKGMIVQGGNENQLIRGNNIVSNNIITHFAAWKRTYTTGIQFGGVGNKYINNILSDAPHEGINGEGNDMLFDNNSFINLAYEVSDAGAWHVGRSWAHRGTVLSNNVFINITTIEKIYLGYPVIAGIYLDDQLSGHNITGNKFFNVNTGVKIGGGRRNIVWNNYFAKCTFGICVTYDDRGLTWQTEFCSPNGMFQQQLEAVNYTYPPWSVHYPELINIFNEQPCVPVYDNIFNNQFCCGQDQLETECKFIDDNNQTIQNWNSTVSNNTQRNWNSKYC